uniref:Uncharacterized protein n=1 Tax=Anguilla anguilla TaxID=7936 RepID=A0A0E9TV28_ANGAN
MLAAEVLPESWSPDGNVRGCTQFVHWLGHVLSSQTESACTRGGCCLESKRSPPVPPEGLTVLQLL